MEFFNPAGLKTEHWQSRKSGAAIRQGISSAVQP
jgi:hypothetical protein